MSIDPPTELKKAHQLWQQDSPLVALKWFRKAAKKHAKNPNVLLDCARALGASHHLKESQSLIQQATKLLGPQPSAQLAIGQTLRMAHQPDRAAKHFHKVIEQLTCAESAIELIVYYERRNMLQEAEELIDKSLKQYPNIPNLSLLKARVLKRRAKLDAALNTLNSLSSLNGIHAYTLAEVYYEKADILDKQQDYQGAYQAATMAKQVSAPFFTPFEGQSKNMAQALIRNDSHT